MSTSREPNSSSDSLSSLSDVDARYLEQPETLLPETKRRRVSSSRVKLLEYTGVNIRDKTHGRTALHKACSKGNLERVASLIEGRGARVDVSDNAGVTPLHDACTRGHFNTVQYLLKHGASVDAVDCEGDYPLLDAVQNDSLEISRILLENGANPTMTNSSGSSALSEADEGPLKDLLRQYSSQVVPIRTRMRIADVLSPEDQAGTSRMSRKRARSRITQLNIDSNGARNVDVNGQDQLHRCVLQEEDELVEQFLQIQECDYQDNYGNTPLHAAARLGNAHICGLLLQYGAKVTTKNLQGNTALAEACYKDKNIEVIGALLDAGASSLIRNKQALTPAQVAAVEQGIGSPMAKMLDKSAEKEQAKLEAKLEAKLNRQSTKKEREASLSASACSTPSVSPRSPRKAKSSASTPTHEQEESSLPFKKLAPRVDTTPEVSVTVSTFASPQFSTSVQTSSKSGNLSPQFLTEFRSTSGLSHVDSSVRGSPLPTLPKKITKQQGQPSRSISSLGNAGPGNTMASVAANSLTHTPTTDLVEPLTNASCSESVGAASGQNSKSTEATLKTPSPAKANGHTAEECNDILLALSSMSRDMVAAIEKQTAVMTALITSIDTSRLDSQGQKNGRSALNRYPIGES